MTKTFRRICKKLNKSSDELEKLVEGSDLTDKLDVLELSLKFNEIREITHALETELFSSDTEEYLTE